MAFILLIVTMMLVVACQGTALEATVAPEPTVAAEATPAAEQEPTEEASATGDTMDSSPDEELAQMAAIAPPPQLSDRELGVHTVPCLPDVSFGVQLVEGEDYTCGVFTVPQNWDDPDGRNLDLGFVVVNAIDDEPRTDALLYLAGGPGNASAILSTDISGYRNLRPRYHSLRYSAAPDSVSVSALKSAWCWPNRMMRPRRPDRSLMGGECHHMGGDTQ